MVGSESGLCAAQGWQDLKLWKYCLGPFPPYPVKGSRALKLKLPPLLQREVHRNHFLSVVNEL